MRLLLDQMIDADACSTLLAAGYDVERISSFGLGRAGDDVVLAKAIDEDRVLVTLDEHFGDWCVLPLDKHPGVIRVKANPATTQTILTVLSPFLMANSERNFANKLVIVGASRTRWIETGA